MSKSLLGQQLVRRHPKAKETPSPKPRPGGSRRDRAGQHSGQEPGQSPRPQPPAPKEQQRPQVAGGSPGRVPSAPRGGPLSAPRPPRSQPPRTPWWGAENSACPQGCLPACLPAPAPPRPPPPRLSSVPQEHLLAQVDEHPGGAGEGRRPTPLLTAAPQGAAWRAQRGLPGNRVTLATAAGSSRPPGPALLYFRAREERGIVTVLLPPQPL